MFRFNALKDVEKPGSMRLSPDSALKARIGTMNDMRGCQMRTRDGNSRIPKPRNEPQVGGESVNRFMIMLPAVE